MKKLDVFSKNQSTNVGVSSDRVLHQLHLVSIVAPSEPLKKFLVRKGENGERSREDGCGKSDYGKKLEVKERDENYTSMTESAIPKLQFFQSLL